MYPSCRSRTDLYAEHNNVLIQTPGMAPIPDIMQPSCCNSVLFTDLAFLEVWKCKHTDQPITVVVGDDTTHPSPRKKFKKKRKKTCLCWGKLRHHHSEAGPETVAEDGL